MTSTPRPDAPLEIATDLVEYLLLLIPKADESAALGTELVRAVESSAVRVLDLVLVTVDAAGSALLEDIDTLPGLEEIRGRTSCFGVLLSRHDVDLIALALQPGDRALVLVVEDRWARPLAAAARAAGGEVRAGERIARDRVEAALARVMTVTSQQSTHQLDVPEV